MNSTLQLLLPFTLSLLIGVSAQAETLSSHFAPLDAVTSAVEHNPELAAALANLRGAGALVESEEHRYSTIWGLEANVSRTKHPELGPDSTIVPRTDSATVSTDLHRRFAIGSSIGVTATGKRTSTRAYFGLPVETFSIGPAYGASVRIDASQPLMRGYGRAVGEAALNQARIQAEESTATLHRVTSDGIAAVLRAYWELAYAIRAREIQQDALRLAMLQRDTVRARVETGAISPTEITSFETRVAQLEADNSDAEVEVARRRIELQRLSSVDTSVVVLQAPPDKASANLDSLDDLRQQARAHSPELRELSAAIRLAEARATTAGDSLRPALDVNAYVQAESMSYHEVSPVAFSGQIGLRYEMPLDSTQRRMQAAQAQFAVQAARKRLEAAERQLNANLQARVVERAASQRRVELAARSVELAERQHKAERSLFETGSSTAIRVREAEEQIRANRLRLLRAQVDSTIAEIEIDRITGRLGRAYLSQLR